MNTFKATAITSDYHYGKLADFKVILRTKDAYINVTKLCKKVSKEFFHWKELKRSKELLSYYDRCYFDDEDEEDDNPRDPQGQQNEFKCIEIVNNDKLEGLTDQQIKLIQGTYVPKEIALKVLEWLDSTKHRKKSTMFNIYIISNDIYTEHQLYKIGYTNNLEQRLKQLQTSSPVPMKVIYSKEYNNAKNIEQKTHEEYSSVRKEGEWFRLDDINECIEFIESL